MMGLRYIESQASYDQDASTGAVNPPSSVFFQDPACSDLVNSAIAQGISTSTTPVMTSTSTATQAGTGVVGVPTSTASASKVDSRMTTRNTARSTAPVSTSAPTPSARLNATSDPFLTTTTCSGRGIDHQALGAISSLVIGLVVGLMIWGTWWYVKKKRTLAGVYGARRWFVDKRCVYSYPSTKISLNVSARSQSSDRSFWFDLGFPPFMWLRTAPSDDIKSVSDTTLVSVVTLAACKLLAWATFASIAFVLPLVIVALPCIDLTAPKGNGGRLGTLNDVSVLRLLDALDPDSSYFSTIPRTAIIQQRNLPSTIRPTLSSARLRLIILVALSSAIIFAPSLLFVAQCLRSLKTFRHRRLREICGGEEMVFIPWKKDRRYGAPTTAPTEQDIRTLANQHQLWDDGNPTTAEEEDERAQRTVNIRALFAIPYVPSLNLQAFNLTFLSRNVTALRRLIDKRNEVLDKLEVAETRYIRSFKANIQPEDVQGETAAERLAEGGETRDQLQSNRNGSPVSRVSDAQTIQRIDVSFQRPSTKALPIAQPKKGRDTRSTFTSGYIAPRDYYKISRLPAIPAEELLPERISTSDLERNQDPPTFTQEVQGRLTGTQFQEVYRDSLMPDGALPPIGTPLAMERGKFHVSQRGDEKALPVPPSAPVAEKSPVAESDQASTEQSGTAGLFGIGSRRSRITFASTAKTEQSRLSIEYTRWSKVHTPASEQLLPLPVQDAPLPSANQAPIRPASGVTTAEISSTYSDIREYRIRLRQLNDQVIEMQAATFENTIEGKKILGYILIGRAVSRIPGAIPFMGMAREDVEWNELELVPHARFLFWLEWISATMIAAICSESAVRNS